MTSGNDILSQLIRYFILYLILCSSAFAADKTQLDINELMKSFSQIKSSQANFVEKKYLRILNKPLEFSGTLAYTAPSHLEKRTLLPKPESLILDQDQVTVENKAKNLKRTFGLQDYPVIGAFVESIRSTLAGDVATLKRYYTLKLTGTNNEWKLLLQPVTENMKAVINEIRINGTRNKISTIEIIEAEGDRSVMTITEVTQ